MQETHLTVQPYRCPKCEHTSPKLSSLLHHYNTHTARFVCSVCILTFPTSNELRKHEKMHRPSVTYPCDICEKVFSLKSTRDQHQVNRIEKHDFMGDTGFVKSCYYKYRTNILHD